MVTVGLITAACGGDDNGDLEAYCELIQRGIGLSASNQSVQATEYEQLREVAPPEIRDSVQELLNTTRGFSDIEELDQLFDAAFDPDAQAARTEFFEHAQAICGYEGAAVAADRVTASTDTLNDLRSYVSSNFGTESWTAKVRFDPVETGDVLTDVEVTFIIPPEDDEPLEACNAVAVYLYELRDGTGAVTVVSDDLIVAGRSGPGAGCETR